MSPQNASKHNFCEKKRLQKLTAIEKNIWRLGLKRIAGVDEAGRGPLAGPVVAAACIIPEGLFFEGINDSKLLSIKVRRSLFESLISHKEVVYGVGEVSHTVIDEINILQATFLAMREAIFSLKEKPDYIIVDGVKIPGIVNQNIIKGDQKSQSIAAASIIAKCRRDELMVGWHEKYPEYGFDQHKGYGTPQHMAALKKHGPSPIHRRSFAPLHSTPEVR